MTRTGIITNIPVSYRHPKRVCMEFRSKVPSHLAGLILVEYLARRFTYHSEASWREHVAAGRVRVNGGAAAPEQMVDVQDLVSYIPEPFDEPEADTNYRVVYEDEWLMGVAKPGNLLVHRAGNAFTRNLIHLVRTGEHGPAVPDAVAVNRLDRETSGVVLLARRPSDTHAFTKALRADGAAKRYTAVVQCETPPAIGSIVAPIGKDPHAGAESYRHAVLSEGGKHAVTRVLGCDRLSRSYAVLDLQAVTGRTHQVRLHCAHVGCPVIGDRLYGVNRGTAAACLPRQALHCREMTFEHPFLKHAVTVAAPLADDLVGLVERLRQEDAGQ